MTNKLRHRKRHEVTENEIKAFNWARESAVAKEMNLKETKCFLENLNLPTNPNFIACITRGENPPILRVRRGVYCVNPKPVHIDRLKAVWVGYAEYGSKKSDADAIATQESIRAAIELLKHNGYKVLKPITKYEEV